MAYVTTRKNRAGEVTSYQVKWRLGGGRDAPQQTERFDDEDSANVFKEAVDEAGQYWPPGWVKGRGFIDPDAGTDEECRFENFARESIKNRTGIEERYRDAIRKELETYLIPTFGNCDVRSTEHFSSATVRAWVNQMAQTKVWRGSKHKLMSPKTLKNLHGLLSSILNEAVQHEPPLRERNPCELTRLPRTDDSGVEEGDEDAEFLTPEEVAGIVDCLKRDVDRRFVRVAYGTGLRWGEITALARRHAITTRAGDKALKVSRAWKRNPGVGAYLGVPKSKRSRRTVEVSAAVWAELVEQGIDSMGSANLIFHNGKGERLPYATFYDRWMPAVQKAKELGLLPEWKNPTFHDLRHSHVAALLSDGHGLTYVQRRLGHESITTTSDRYGHLLPQAHGRALETIDRAVYGSTDPTVKVFSHAPAKEDTRPVYVARLGTLPVGFWDVEHAEETAGRWAKERGTAVAVEKWSSDWWRRTVGNGVQDVRKGVPDRAWLWFLGPAVYGPDGAERGTDTAVHELEGRWVWEFETAYTDEPFLTRTEWRPGPEAETEAEAWGSDKDAVREAYAQARADALRICAHHPARAAAGQRETAG